MANRLAGETSPYLLQHKDNPVDWYPWGPEAFSRAQAENKPIFLSIGYSSCHWCHVMEHETFEDAAAAAILNEFFVSVKVDREELPDVDETFMTAVQLSSGRGGWPMSVFLTPDLKPFFAATYIPRDDYDKYPGFKTIARQVATAWQMNRLEIQRTGDEFARAMAEAMSRTVPATQGRFDEAMLERAVTELIGDFDRANGGFGTAPKFPPHSALSFLISYSLRPESKQELREAALAISFSTLDRMIAGGIHDHVGGGFHRYSTDERWLLPHFEKMLYDNALMLRSLVRASMVAGHINADFAQRFGQAAYGILAWLTSEMQGENGLFYSALDADSEGEEGAFYLWTKAEIDLVLGSESEAFCAAYGVTHEGNFEDEATRQRTGKNVLHEVGEASADFSAAFEKLLQARAARPRPSLDHKALVGWNGLLIEALAECGQRRVAETAARAILVAAQVHGSLPRQITNGQPSGFGYLEDYAHFAGALFSVAELARLDQDPGSYDEWRMQAHRLTEEMIERFYDEELGGFFGTSDRHDALFGRSKPMLDQPIPSANAAALRCLIEINDMARATQTVSVALGWMERAPGATESLYEMAMVLVGGTEIVAEASDPARSEESAPVVIAAPKREVEVRLSAREIAADAQGIGHGTVTLLIPEGLHLNTNDPPARWLTATKLSFAPVKAAVNYPKGVDEAYEGNIDIPFTIEVPKGESGAEFELLVTFQPCTDTECLAPVERRFSGVVYR